MSAPDVAESALNYIKEQSDYVEIWAEKEGPGGGRPTSILHRSDIAYPTKEVQETRGEDYYQFPASAPNCFQISGSSAPIVFQDRGT